MFLVVLTVLSQDFNKPSIVVDVILPEHTHLSDFFRRRSSVLHISTIRTLFTHPKGSLKYDTWKLEAPALAVCLFLISTPPISKNKTITALVLGSWRWAVVRIEAISLIMFWYQEKTPSICCVCPHEVPKAARRLYEIDKRFEGKFCKDFG